MKRSYGVYPFISNAQSIIQLVLGPLKSIKPGDVLMLTDIFPKEIVNAQNIEAYQNFSQKAI